MPVNAKYPMNTSATPVRVLLADDHSSVLDQTKRLLGPDCEIVGTAANGFELLEAAARLEADVIVLDITMPGLDGLEAARRLKQAGCRSALVFLTVHEDADFAREAFAVGALAYVVKSRLAADLLPAIEAALAGHRFISPPIDLKSAT